MVPALVLVALPAYVMLAVLPLMVTEAPVTPVIEPPVAVTVPLTLTRLMPFVPPDAVTDPRLRESGVRLAVDGPVRLMAAAPRAVLRLPVLFVTAIVPVLFRPTKPGPFVFVPANELNVTVPVLP